MMNNKSYLQDWQRQHFYQIFKTPISKYWNMLTGFDIFKFDDEFIKPPDGLSCSQAITEKYGKEAADFVSSLFDIIPALMLLRRDDDNNTEKESSNENK